MRDLRRSHQTAMLLPILVMAVAAGQTRSGADMDSASSSRLRIALVGQALIHEDLRRVAAPAVEQARGYLAGNDVIFTNLETALAPKNMPLELRAPGVRPTGLEVLDALKDMGFNMLSLANNHAWDLGAKGLLAGRDEVEKHGFAHAGTGPDAAAAAAAGYLDTPAGKVALVAMASGASQLAKPNTWAAPGRPGVNYLNLGADGELDPEQKARILGAVREAARNAKFVIAYQHNHFWGEPTGVAAPPHREKRVNRFETPAWLVTWAHELIDAGASLYVAHGDPALHGVEIYHGRPILFGLETTFSTPSRVLTSTGRWRTSARWHTASSRAENFPRSVFVRWFCRSMRRRMCLAAFHTWRRAGKRRRCCRG